MLRKGMDRLKFMWWTDFTRRGHTWRAASFSTTYGSTLELYGQQFTAGMLTADLTNLSPDEYMRPEKA